MWYVPPISRTSGNSSDDSRSLGDPPIDNVAASVYIMDMNNNERGSQISDDRLILVTSHGMVSKAQYNGERTYQATYEDGSVVGFAVASAEHARVYAREYGMRFLGGARMISCKWDR